VSESEGVGHGKGRDVNRKCGLLFIVPHQVGTLESGILGAAFSAHRESILTLSLKKSSC